MELTSEHLDAATHGAVQITVGGKSFVLMSQDEFDRVQAILNDELTPDEKMSLAWEGGRSIGWEDDDMKAYDEYEKHRP